MFLSHLVVGRTLGSDMVETLSGVEWEEWVKALRRKEQGQFVACIQRMW